jgi:hypothetical protein
VIDWLSLSIGVLWILGGALASAILDQSYWRAQTNHKRFLVVLRERGQQIKLNVSADLFSLGSLGSVSEWWERALWGILTVLFATQLWQATRY